MYDFIPFLDHLVCYEAAELERWDVDLMLWSASRQHVFVPRPLMHDCHEGVLLFYSLSQ